MDDPQGRPPIWPLLGLIALIIVIGLLLMSEGTLKKSIDSLGLGGPSRQMRGEILGILPKPTQPSLQAPIQDAIKPRRLTKVLIKRIPRINPGAKMPHPYWGPCTKCHLIRGGAPAGSQPATPVAKVWERASKEITKFGPPILPDSARPHPASGRCIKCHDVLVQVQTK
ncbi:MAG: magnetochrome domain-containing protein [Magnetococcales bacterium]|nr:magnetochrome domain-containing protein [Magnetococcales bacterium]